MLIEPLAIDPREAARLTGFTTKHFENLRERGDGPPFVKLRNKRIRYPYQEFKEWFAREMGRAAA
jgi:predicted DNA-binding transcriptional regulator AlpA